MASAALIRPATLNDAAEIAAIYNREVTTSTSTFDLVERSVEDQERWIEQRSGAFCAIVAIADESVDQSVLGFAALSPYRERAAYRTTVEDSVYVHRDHAGSGVGTALLTHLVGVARDSGFHAVMARIEASGEASLALHRSCGFELLGIEREVGRKFNRWLDVAVMQLML